MKWMANHFLQLNEIKTEALLLGPDATNDSIKRQFGSLSNNLHSHAKNLAVYLDPLLQFDKHVNALIKSGFFQLRSVAKVKHFLSSKDLEITIYALISFTIIYVYSIIILIATNTYQF